MGSHLIDTNAVIEFLGGRLPNKGAGLLQSLMDSQSACLSVINKIELLGYDGPEDEMQIVAEFIRNCQLLPLSEEIAEITIEIRKAVRIKLPDAIIAATAIHHDLILVTRNVKDFSCLSEIDTINPHEL